MSADELLQRLRAVLGVRLGDPVVARDPVNLPMIRHWCDAVDDRNPVYTDPEFAARSLHGGIVAPPTMLQAWTMPGLVPKEVREARTLGACFGALRLLDEAGFTSVVATNCTQEYVRYLRPGDLLSAETVIEAVSEEKQTALGVGHFVTQRTTLSRPARRARREHELPPAQVPAARARERRAARGGAAAPEARHHPRQPLLLGGRRAARAAHPALQRLPAPPAPARPDVRRLSRARSGLRALAGPRQRLQLRLRAPPGACRRSRSRT